MIRILLADDQSLVRGALAALINMEPDMKVVAEVGRGDEVLAAAKAQSVDIALLDIEMPGEDGLSVAAHLHKELPSCRILILTTFGKPGYLKKALVNGVQGFITKDGTSEQLAAAIRRVQKGDRVIDPQVAISALSYGESPLTSRERDVLVAVSEGLSIKCISETLNLTPGTVRNYLSIAIQKLGAANRIQAVRIAQEQGWL
jgi:two-component system response regulator DesR